MKAMLAAMLVILFSFGCQTSSRQACDFSLIPVKSGDNFQYIDTEGKIVINPQFSSASLFWGDLALVGSESKEGEKFGFIDKNGKYVINPVYKSCTIFSENIAFCVMESAAPTAINVKGEVLFTLQDYQYVRILREGMAAVCKRDSSGEKWGFIDSDGGLAIVPQYNAVGNFSNGLCAILDKSEKWGYIDKDENIAINCQFDSAGEFQAGRAVVEKDDKWGVINEKGGYVIKPEYESISIDGSNYLIGQNDKYGWCDENGKVLINPQFEDAKRFNGNKYAVVSNDEKMGYIDNSGNFVINPQFEGALPFNDDFALVLVDDKIGLIGQDGKIVVSPQFDDLSIDYIEASDFSKSAFNVVKSDYFDISQLTSTFCSFFSDSLVSGNRYDETIPVILQRYNITKEERVYGDGMILFQDKEIVPGAKYSMYVGAEDFWTYDFQGFEFVWHVRSNATPNRFVYLIELSECGAGKAAKLKEKLEKKLTQMQEKRDVAANLDLKFSVGDSSRVFVEVARKP